LQINQPRIRVTIGGVPVSGAIAAEIESVAFFAADRFSVTVSLTASGMTFDDFAATVGQVILIEAAVQELGYVALLTGQVDNVFSDLLLKRVTVSGRDLAARLIDSEIAETFANQTSSQIAISICARHDLTANVTTTSTLVGQYYELDHARSSLGVNSRGGTEWNLLSWLAVLEGFLLSVAGTTLTFGMAPLLGPFPLNVQSCIDLAIDVAGSLPKTTVVRSWNARNKVTTTQSAGDGSKIATLIRPGLTSQQALKLAENHLETLQAHETVLTARFPGETSLVPGATISLAGTASKYDGTYVIYVIRRSIDAERGFVQRIRAHALN
jgi:hypothetical protein